MNRPKLLITGGCSYSQIPNTDVAWPQHLQNYLDPDYHIHTGKRATGNEIISHRVIYKVNKALEQGFNPEDILVGVMWSGCDRMAMMTTNFDKLWEEGTILGPDDKEDWTEDWSGDHNMPEFYERDNPQSLDIHIHRYVTSSPSWIAGGIKPKSYNWHTINPHWTDKLTIKYFEDFINPEYALIQTCEHILRTQWYLKSHHIKYFMCPYEQDTFVYVGPAFSSHGYSANAEGKSPYPWTSEHVSLINEHPEINWLYKMIDRSYWLNIRHMGDWINRYCADLPYREVTDPHPSSDMHQQFTEKVILPFLLKKYNISRNNSVT
jgi:hypothetical protein